MTLFYLLHAPLHDQYAIFIFNAKSWWHCWKEEVLDIAPEHQVSESYSTDDLKKVQQIAFV